MSKYAYFLIILLATFLNSCQEDYNYTAEKKTLNQIMDAPGFVTFKVDFDSYKPDTSIISEIKKLYNPALHKLLLFVSPSCYTCNIDQKSFALFSKVIVSANIADSLYEIYSMRSVQDEFPYENLITDLNSLPSFYLLKNSVPVHSIYDSISSTEDRKKYGIDSTFERQLLLALKK